MNVRPLLQMLDDARAARMFSGASFEVGTHSGALADGTIGTTAWGATPLTRDTPFDIASVTKPLVGLLCMALIELGELALEDSVPTYLPELSVTDKRDITIAELLTHTSGIPGQQPLYQTARTPAELLKAVRELPLLYPPGSGVAYSSQGFMILGQILESVTGEPLHACLTRLVLEPLGMKSTSFGLPSERRELAAATERCPWRGRLIQGTVHDENAHALGGYGGHAGLFSTVTDLARMCRSMLRRGATESGQLLSARTVDAMTRPRTDHLSRRRCFAWQGRDAVGCPGGTKISASSYGHTGFTGTSVWIDPEADRYIILLTNAVHPKRDPERIRSFRPRFHDLVISSADSDPRK